MPRCNVGDVPLSKLLDRYGGRIEAHVAEDSGGRFDIALTVQGLEIASIRLRGSWLGVLLYTDSNGPAALDSAGALVPLP